MTIKKIYDSFVDIDEKEIFLCQTSTNERLWFRKHDISKTVLDKFLKRKNANDQYKRQQLATVIDTSEKICNVDKTDAFTCELKCRTRGLIIACNCCGIISGFKELFGAESLTQVALMLLEMKSYAAGAIIILTFR